MNKARRDSSNRFQRRHVPSHMDGRVQFLLNGEEHLLSAIASRASLQGILNGICSALNFQIGNVVSLIARSGNDDWDLGEGALKAALCGLFMFSSESILAEDGEVLGNFEVYCCVSRKPTDNESQLIKRAGCLATVAIKLIDETESGSDQAHRGNWPALITANEWSLSLN
jgi:hypothetical protein